MKTAFITGGNRGIGLEVCRRLIDLGFEVYMGARDTQKGVEAYTDITTLLNRRIHVIQIDVESELSIASAASVCPPLDVFVNNAGARLDWVPNGPSVKTLEITQEELIQIYKVNVFAPILCAKHFKHLFKPGCRIVNVGSGVGEFWDGNAQADFQIGYAPSKSALLMTTKKMAAALAPLGVTVNAACPNWCRTEMGGENAPDSASDGALSIITALFLDSAEPPTGQYFRHGNRVPIEVRP